MRSASALVPPITVLGSTALSVEIRHTRSTWWRVARSASVAVASALLAIAWMGLISIIGTCLYAAAWKTISGRCAVNTCSIRSASRQSATTGVGACPRSRSSRSISKRLFSAWSTMTRLLGPTAATCRQSSDPIDPPAPVTSTRRPFR